MILVLPNESIRWPSESEDRGQRSAAYVQLRRAKEGRGRSVKRLKSYKVKKVESPAFAKASARQAEIRGQVANIAWDQSKGAGPLSTWRLWLATAAVIILVIAVWKFIDYRMRPPPPGGEPAATETKP